MDFTFSSFQSRYSTEVEVHTFCWEHWVKELTSNLEFDQNKSRLPGLVLGKMHPGEARKNKNVRTVEGLALDIERRKKGGFAQTPEEYTELLAHALHRVDHLEYVAYTTFSHTPDDPRIRLIFPLRAPIQPSAYKFAMSYLNCLTGSVADKAAQKLSQPVYLPRHPAGAVEHTAWHHPGDMLDLQDPLVEEIVELRLSLGEGRGRAPAEAHIRQACKKVLMGYPYAAEGNRDEMVMRIAWHLSKRNLGASLEAVEEVFYWSTRAMGDDAPDAESIHSKLVRGEEKRAEEVVEVQPPPDEISIVQFRSNLYFRLPEGGFSRAFSKDEAKFASYKHLQRLPGVQINYASDKGAAKRKSLDRLLEEYGDLAEEVIIDLRESTSHYEDGVLREATVMWPTSLEPTYDEDIDTWLSLLSGETEKLKDWLSILADLDRLSSALVLMGPRSIGKTLLAMGCASRFGSQTPAKQGALTGRFQEELARCPLVYIDEDIEDNPYDRNFLSTIRAELSIRERSVNRKYLAPLQMLGSIRCIISANHLPFRQKDSQTGQDLQAIAERFYWINANKDAAQFLKSVGSERLNQWRRRGIAEHIMHLEETRDVPHTSRFGVSGDGEQLTDLLNLGVRWNSWVTEWLCNGVMDGFVKLIGDKDVSGGGIIHEGEIYVRVKTIVKAWDIYLPNNKTAPDTRPISEALKGISGENEKYRPRDIGRPEGNNQQQYFRIRQSPLLAFLDQTGAGTKEELLAALAKGNRQIGGRPQ